MNWNKRIRQHQQNGKLNQAIYDSKINKVREAIFFGANVNIIYYQRPPLIVSLLLGNHVITECLIEKGANPLIKSPVNDKNFIEHFILDDVKIELTSVYDFRDTLNEYRIQKLLISNVPENQISEVLVLLHESHLINSEISNEYAHVLSGYELNLL